MARTTETIDAMRCGLAAPRRRASLAARLRCRLRDLFAALARMAERRRSRRALAALTDEALRDIGISRAQARRESARPFWD